MKKIGVTTTSGSLSKKASFLLISMAISLALLGCSVSSSPNLHNEKPWDAIGNEIFGDFVEVLISPFRCCQLSNLIKIGSPAGQPAPLSIVASSVLFDEHIRREFEKQGDSNNVEIFYISNAFISRKASSINDHVQGR